MNRGYLYPLYYSYEHFHTIIIINIIENESAEQGWEKARTLFNPKTTTPHNQLVEKKKK